VVIGLLLSGIVRGPLIFHLFPPTQAGAGPLPPFTGEPMIEGLTRREVDILRLMTGGFSNREIGSALNVVEDTVKNHVSNILGKLGVRDRIRAVLRAIELGYV
jgi:DNA-binding NarL/FixJ family response regulator